MGIKQLVTTHSAANVDALGSSVPWLVSPDDHGLSYLAKDEGIHAVSIANL